MKNRVVVDCIFITVRPSVPTISSNDCLVEVWLAE